MKKFQVFIAVDSLVMGGIQKSLVAFIRSVKSFCEIDILVWHENDLEMIRLPEYVNRIHVIGTESVRTAYRKYGIFSLNFLFSALGSMRKKRWLAVPRLKKKYDIAIAYSHVSSLKYYTIDKVTAEKKFAFYHHGAYIFSEKIRRYDLEYYQQYDKVYAVSDGVKKLLMKTFPELHNISVLPNLIDVEEIKKCAGEPCPEFPDDQRLRLLTVGRLSPEKNPMQIIETARLLVEKRVKFIWMIVGDGELRQTLESTIRENKLEGKVVLTGNQMNPYRFMSRCDCYLQFSLYEADPVTVREAAVFDRHMVLSDIPGFRDCSMILKNINLCRNAEEAADRILHILDKPADKNNLEKLNSEIVKQIYHEMFDI
ncbi:MAG: glycosyltransferase [Sarcina sp.]|nr:glycosyltransferase [Sarcina sp.]